MKGKNSKAYFIAIVGVLALIVLVSGATYAYYAAGANNNNAINGNTATTGLELTVTKLSEAATGKLIPLDSDPTSLTTAAKGYGFSGTVYDKTKSCIDKNGYSVCQIYQITVKNTSTVGVRLKGGITKLGGATVPNITCDVMASSTSVIANKNCKSSTSLETDKLFAADESKTYYIIVYIKNINDKQEDKGSFSGVVEFSTDTGKLQATFD